MKYPNFFFEKKLWEKGFKRVAGVDEVGRGSFSGSVVAGCVVFDENLSVNRFKDIGIKIDDSKKLTSRQREKSSEWIKKNALAWGIGESCVFEINRKGMGKATLSAFRRAITDANKRLTSRIDYLLIDAYYIPYVRGIRMPAKYAKYKNRRTKKPSDIKYFGNELAIINGDEKSLSIGAASIIAKVYRDNLMTKLGRLPKYKVYRWEKNKGYGTKEHRYAIKKYGTTKLHRKKFVETLLKKRKK